MSEQNRASERTAPDARRHWRVAVPVAVAAVAVAALVVVGRARPAVKWSAVLEAAGGRETMHGRGRVYLKDGTEWDYALWAKIEGAGRFITKGMARPVSLRPGEEELSSEPPPELPMLCDAMNCCGEGGIVERLSGAGGGRARARRCEWGGRAALMVEVETRKALGESGEGYPDGWCFYLDPDAKLVRGMELFMVEEGELRLRGRCAYEYDLPLPPGFEEAPG